MKTTFRASFARDLKKITDQSLLRSIRQIILDTEQASDLSRITQLRKLSGSGNYFRVRVGEYRIGLMINGDIVEFVRCLHRREIYRFFP